MENSLVTAKGQKVVTDSLRVAEVSGKKHKYILGKIENLKKDDKKGRLIFRLSSYLNSQNKNQKKYDMDRRSFSILSMGFTGKKALNWKNDFYDAFEKMENYILQKQNLSWQQTRIEGKQNRSKLTDSIKKLVELAESSGSSNSDRYYLNFSKMVYQQVFNINKVPLNFRDTLDQDSLEKLKMVEVTVSQWLNEATETCKDYHEPYKEIKGKLKALISVIGAINPIHELAA